tara:strand:+ start:1334 stop:1582 length:249 start_codon:yes stop_codon:yes gene_type:complete
MHTHDFWMVVDKHESEEDKEIAEAKFKDIQEAYNLLQDPKKKQLYDSGKDLDDIQSGGGGGGFSGESMFTTLKTQIVILFDL